MIRTPILILAGTTSIGCLIVGQTAPQSNHLLSISNIANLSAVAVIGYSMSWIVCKGFPKWLIEQRIEREAEAIRNQSERDTSRKDFLKQLEAINTRNDAQHSEWRKTINEVVRNCAAQRNIGV